MGSNIKWNKAAVGHLEKILDFIAVDSIINSEKMGRLILEKIEGLVDYPERYSPDKYKKHNNGSYRAFEVKLIRISYRLYKKDIRIIRLRHTKMNPLKY